MQSSSRTRIFPPNRTWIELFHHLMWNSHEITAGKMKPHSILPAQPLPIMNCTAFFMLYHYLLPMGHTKFLRMQVTKKRAIVTQLFGSSAMCHLCRTFCSHWHEMDRCKASQLATKSDRDCSFEKNSWTQTLRQRHQIKHAKKMYWTSDSIQEI